MTHFEQQQSEVNTIVLACTSLDKILQVGKVQIERSMARLNTEITQNKRQLELLQKVIKLCEEGQRPDKALCAELQSHGVHPDTVHNTFLVYLSCRLDCPMHFRSSHVFLLGLLGILQPVQKPYFGLTCRFVKLVVMSP